MMNNGYRIDYRISGKDRLAVVLGISLFFAGLLPAFSADYIGRSIKVQADTLGGSVGKQMTASGGVVIESPGVKMQAAKATWFFDATGKQIKLFEASANVSFHLDRTDKAGYRILVDGEGDELIYNPADGTVRISVSDAGATAKSPRKAHMHVVEKPAPTKAPTQTVKGAIEKAPVKAATKVAAKTSPKTGGTTAEAPKEYDIYAPVIVINLKQRTFTTSGGRAAIETEVMEATSSETPAKTEAAPATTPQVEGK